MTPINGNVIVKWIDNKNGDLVTVLVIEEGNCPLHDFGITYNTHKDEYFLVNPTDIKYINRNEYIGVIKTSSLRVNLGKDYGINIEKQDVSGS